MKKNIIKVPIDLDYISNWENYNLPKGHCIVDKGVTGCGYTEYTLTNKDDVVLCSPRKLLLENKFDQHTQDHNIFYLRNELENYSNLNELKEKLKTHILNCGLLGKPVKILVTYDSAYLIVDCLKEFGIIQDYYFIVDEFQSIFLDSYFKSSVENDFIEYLQDCSNVLYLSATPMLDKYLEKLDAFKDLDFYQLDWKNSLYTETVNIQRKRTNSLGHECKKIIESYLKGKFPIALDDSGNPMESKEAVFYLNSISDIIRIVKGAKLSSSNTRIICSDTPENKNKLKRIGFEVSKVPLKDEPNKMFTFCTRSVYIGSDFYSDCASTYIFADPNIQSLALDISLDLPQIVGRQRNRNNPFKNRVIIFYKTIQGENIEDIIAFQEKQLQRKENSQAILDIFNNCKTDKERINLLRKIRDGIIVSMYGDDFISISKKTGKPVYNPLIELANERAWEVSQKDYQDKVSVTKSILNQGYNTENYYDTDDTIVNEFLDNQFYKTNVFENRMKMYCEFMDKYRSNPYILSAIFHKTDPKYKTYYDYFGTSGCKAVSYKEIYLLNKLTGFLKSGTLRDRLISRFKIGSKYTLKQIKLELKMIYQELGITKTPKASELEKYFNLKITLIPEGGKRNKGYEILGIL